MAARKSAATKRLKVVGPLATPYLQDGSRAYFYEGALLPDGLRDGEADRLIDLGLVAEVEVEDDSEGTSEGAEA